MARFPLSPTPACPPSSCFAALLAPQSGLRHCPESWRRSGRNAGLSSGGSILSIPLPPPATRPQRPVPFASLSRASPSDPQVRAALPGSAPRARLLPSRPSRGSVLSRRLAGALAHRRSARAAAATAAEAAGAGAGSAGARRAEQPWGSWSARLGYARLWGLSRLTASRGAGAGAEAGAPAGAEPGRLGAGATCLPRSAGGAGGARPLAPSCTHPGDLSASPGVRAPHSHRPRPPLPLPAACRPPFPPLPVPSPSPLSPEARSGEQKSRRAL